MTDRQSVDEVDGAKVTPSARRTTAARDEDVRAVREAADELPWVDDRVSKLWVALVVAVFGLILLYGILFGNAGLLTPVASPSPSPSQAPVSTPTVRTSPTPRSSPGVSPSPGSSPAASPGPSLPASPATSPAATPAAPPSPAAS